MDVSVRRVGGAYGAKVNRAHWIAAGCGLAANATRRSDSYYLSLLPALRVHPRPVRIHMDIDSNMKMIGKRIPYYATYTVSKD